MLEKSFEPKHINACFDDFEGNNGLGRYVFFPGSDGRAKEIAERCFTDIKVKKHSRQHNLYLGTLIDGELKLDVASIASGMGTPSLDIILNELIKLGAKRFLRVGTCGLLQPKYMNAGDLVIATGAIRDEGASRCYAPLEYPAISSIEFVLAAQKAAENLGFASKTHTGIIHSKDSLYAREFGEGPLASENQKYVSMLRNAGAIASEMEASAMFIITEWFNHKLKMYSQKDELLGTDFIKSGTVCTVLGEGDDFGTKDFMKQVIDEIVSFAEQTVVQLAKSESELL